MSLRPNSLKFVGTKVLVDGFLFGPIHLLVFFTYTGFSAGKNLPQVKEDVKREFIPAFILEGGVWPAVQVVNLRFVPVRYQLLYVAYWIALSCLGLSSRKMHLGRNGCHLFLNPRNKKPSADVIAPMAKLLLQFI